MPDANTFRAETSTSVERSLKVSPKNETARLNNNSSSPDDGGFANARSIRAFDNYPYSQSTNSARSAEEHQDSVSISTLPSETKLKRVIPDAATQIQPPSLVPLEYFHHGSSSFPTYETTDLRRQVPAVRVMVSNPGFDPASYNESWKTSNTYLDHNLSPHYTTSTFGPPMLNHSNYPSMGVSYANSNPQTNNLSGTTLRPRSMSLSGSSTCSRHSSSLSSNAYEKTDQGLSKKQQKLDLKNTSPTRTLSPFDSGNDSGRSIQVFVPCSKKPSLTLV